MTDIRSEVAGSIWKIACGVGDSIVAGETIMIVEAMKMEIPVEAPQSGRLAQLFVAEGDAIGEGHLLARLVGD